MESGVYLMDDDAFLDFVEAMQEHYSKEVEDDLQNSGKTL